MMTSPLDIKKLVKAALADKELQKAVASGTAQALSSREISVKQLPYWEILREKISATKSKVIGNLDEYLQEFENNCKKNGIIVHWATDSKEALGIINDLVIKKEVKKIVKSKSLTTEEIQLNPYLEKKSIEVMETDLGEFIIQLKEESLNYPGTPSE